MDKSPLLQRVDAAWVDFEKASTRNERVGVLWQLQAYAHKWERGVEWLVDWTHDWKNASLIMQTRLAAQVTATTGPQWLLDLLATARVDAAHTHAPL